MGNPLYYHDSSAFNLSYLEPILMPPTTSNDDITVRAHIPPPDVANVFSIILFH